MGKIMTKVGIRHVYSLGNTVRSSLAASHPSLLHLGPPLHSVTYYVRDPKLLFVALTFLRTWLLYLDPSNTVCGLQFGSEFLIDPSRTSFAKSFILSMVLGLWVNSRTMDSE